MTIRTAALLGAAALAVTVAVPRPFAQAGRSGALTTSAGEWPSYAGDRRNHHYSPLEQINAGNFNAIEIAWRFKTDALGTRPEYKLEGTPLMVGGVIYATGGSRRAVVALDAGTGELLWMHGEHEGERGAASPRQLSGRGLSYWTDGREERILYVTTGYRLVALNAKTGARIPGFGSDGIVDLKDGVVFGSRQPIDLVSGEIGLHATPAIAGDVVMVGAAMREGGTPKTHNNTKGLVRGFDVRTGKRLWTFNTIPRPGEFGNDSWLNDSWAVNGNVGVWNEIAVDESLGLAYLPVETPSSDFYGGLRPGNNLFAESIVAIDVKTGQRKWHYQLVHHPIWNMDIAAAPMLVDITVGGRPIKAVAVMGKQAMLYVFDRVTGMPVFPIEERPVPKGDVPGEWYSPTQPFPTKPPAYDHQGVTEDNLIDFTPELNAEARRMVSRYRLGPLFTPTVLSKPEGPLGSFRSSGGTNWPGSRLRSRTHVALRAVVHLARAARPDAAAEQGVLRFARTSSGNALTGVRYISGPGENVGADVPSRRGRRLAPAWPRRRRSETGGSLTAAGIASAQTALRPHHGDRSRQRRFGLADRARRNAGLRPQQPGAEGGHHSADRAGRSVRRAGHQDAGHRRRSAGDDAARQPRGAMLRAYDKASGKEVGSVYMPAPQSGTPMTYMLNGKQYIIVAVSGGNYSGEYLVYRLR